MLNVIYCKIKHLIKSKVTKPLTKLESNKLIESELIDRVQEQGIVKIIMENIKDLELKIFQ